MPSEEHCHGYPEPAATVIAAAAAAHTADKIAGAGVAAGHGGLERPVRAKAANPGSDY